MFDEDKVTNFRKLIDNQYVSRNQIFNIRFGCTAEKAAWLSQKPLDRKTLAKCAKKDLIHSTVTSVPKSLFSTTAKSQIRQQYFAKPTKVPESLSRNYSDTDSDYHDLCSTAKQVGAWLEKWAHPVEWDSKKNEYVAFRSEAVVTKTGYSLLTGEA